MPIGALRQSLISEEVEKMREANSMAVPSDLCSCTLPRLARLNRAGLVDKMFSSFGRYPWVCRSCGSKKYRSERGRKRTEAQQEERSAQQA